MYAELLNDLGDRVFKTPKYVKTKEEAITFYTLRCKARGLYIQNYKIRFYTYAYAYVYAKEKI